MACIPPRCFQLVQYKKSRAPSNSSQHPYLHRLESAVLEGQAVFRTARELRESSWLPDCVISHVGFGNGLFLKECFPHSKRIGLVEWFYNYSGSDVDFLNASSVSDDHKLRLRAWNAETLLEMSSLDTIVTPTYWQRSQFPALFRGIIDVIHEGIDIDSISSVEVDRFQDFPFLGSSSNTQVLTYVSRCFEEYRGFPQAIRTISKLQKRFPDLHVILVGQDGQAYGSARSDGQPWSLWAKSNLELDPLHTLAWLSSRRSVSKGSCCK